jgi:hypothetical protein
MKNHKWKYDTEIGELRCTKCGIYKLKDKFTGDIVYLDATKHSYFQERIKEKRPDCI